MKRIVVFCFATLLVISAVGFGSVQLYDLLEPGTDAETCSYTGTKHTVTIADGKVAPAHTTGKLCDTMTVKNTDNVLRYIAFGRHDEHQTYDGITSKTMEDGQSFTITLEKTGNHRFHDHLHDEVFGTFTVRP